MTIQLAPDTAEMVRKAASVADESPEEFLDYYLREFLGEAIRDKMMAELFAANRYFDSEEAAWEAVRRAEAIDGFSLWEWTAHTSPEGSWVG